MLRIVVEGGPDTGKTTVASLIKDFLVENGFQSVTLVDIPGLPHDQKDDFPNRLERTRERPVQIQVRLQEEPPSRVVILWCALNSAGLLKCQGCHRRLSLPPQPSPSLDDVDTQPKHPIPSCDDCFSALLEKYQKARGVPKGWP